VTPLDLTKAPPRLPSEPLAGIIFMARTVDKLRASLPGGALGEYVLTGLTTMQAEMLELPLDRLRSMVEAAADDADLARQIEAQVDPERRDAWNAFIQARKPGGGDPGLALQLYPWLGERPDLIYTLEILPEDDRRTFSAN
jgi:hypothetical protein